MSVLTASTAVARPAERHRVLGDASRGTKARVTLRWPSGATAVEAASLTQNCLYERYIVHGTYSTVFKVCMQAAGALDRTCNCTVPVPVPGPPNETKQCQGTTTVLRTCPVAYVPYAGALARHEEVSPQELRARAGGGAVQAGRRSDGAITIHYCAMRGRAS
jgi:hypothetical protein